MSTLMFVPKASGNVSAMFAAIVDGFVEVNSCSVMVPVAESTIGYGTETVEVGQIAAGNAVRNNSTEGYGGGISVNLQPGIGADHAIKVVNNAVSNNSGERGGGGIHGFFLMSDPDNGGTGTIEISDNAMTGNHASGLPGSGVLGGGGMFAATYS